MTGPRPATGAPPPPVRVLLASAGTGKTYRLTARYLRLLRDGASPGSILATTFTRKAAAEILERVQRWLARAATDPTEARRLGAAIGVHRFTRKDAAAMLRRFAGDLDGVSVVTLDALFARLASALRLELGLPEPMRVVDSNDPLMQPIRREALNDAVSRRDFITLMDLLQRLLHDTKRDVTPTLAKLAESMRRWIEAAPQADAWSRLQRRAELSDEELAAQRQALATAAANASDGNQRRAARTMVDRVAGEQWDELVGSKFFEAARTSGGSYHRKPIEPGLVEPVKAIAAHAAARVVNDQVDWMEAVYELALDYTASMLRRRRDAGLLEFNDLPRLLAARMESDPEVRLDLELRLGQRFDHLLLDEFQDTSLLQWTMLRPMAEEIRGWAGEPVGEKGERSGGGSGEVGEFGESEESGESGGGESRSMLVVGDKKQSIYGWRGGSAAILEAMPTVLRLPESAVESIDVSWRSSQVVLDSVNRVFDGIERAPGLAEYADVVRGWRAGFPAHRAAWQGLSGLARLIALSATDGSGDASPEDDAIDDEDASADRDTVVQSADHVASLRRSHPGRSIGVLTARNATADGILTRLGEQGVEAAGAGGMTLDRTPAVASLLSLLTLLDHPGDGAARAHVAAGALGPVVGVTEDASERAWRSALAAQRMALADRGFASVIGQWAEAASRSCDAGERRALEAVVELADAWPARWSPRARDFAEYVEATAVEGGGTGEGAPVRVMTVHKSKGLEFDIVVLTELEGAMDSVQRETVVALRPGPLEPVEAIVPHPSEAVRSCDPLMKAAHDQAASDRLRDELSRLYVAMTRPRRQLDMLVSPMKRTKGGWSKTGWENCSPAAVLRRTLVGEPDEDEAGGVTLWEQGDPAWDASPAKAGEARSGAEAAEAETSGSETEARAGASGGPRIELATGGARRTWRTVTPSRLAASATVDAGAIVGGRSEAGAAGRRLGLLVHGWLERLAFVDAEARSLAAAIAEPERRAAAAALGIEPGESAWVAAESLLDRALAAPEVRAALSRPGGDGAVELWRERPFAVRDAGAMVTGTFDRVVIERDPSTGAARSARVQDFKTDRLGEGGASAAERAIERLTAHYRPQLEAYRRAASILLGLAPGAVCTELVLLDAGRVVTVA